MQDIEATTGLNEAAKPKGLFFSVVTAVYNSAPWLECYFNSLFEQSIGFEEHIQVILVDDGSTDDSWEMINEYARRYPKNILCLKKENGGPASARNMGLKHVKGEWVTFIDSDDFVNENYFKTVLEFIRDDGFLGALVCCKPIFYMEANAEFSDRHPLSYRFNGKIEVINLLNSPKYILLASNSCFFMYSIIEKHQVLFDESIVPSFEDSHFVNIYFLKCKNYVVGFIGSAFYYYRKRASQTSLIDTGWKDERKFSDELYYGCYGLVDQYKREIGYVPVFIQNVIVYHVHWYCNVIYNNMFIKKNSDIILSVFFKIMRNIFKYIDVSVVMHSELPMLTLRSRAIILNVFMRYDNYVFPLIIAEISNDKNSMVLLHYSSRCSEVMVLDEKKDSVIISNKIIKRVGYGELLFYEQKIVVKIDSPSSISSLIGGESIPIVSRKNILNNPTRQDILDSFYFSIDEIDDERIDYFYLSSLKQYTKYERCWLLMDRILKSDDNAEHFYRWMASNHSEVKIYYVLSRDSADWNRLENDGFSLLEYGSKEHYIALFKAEWLISSHADEAVVDPLRMRSRYGIPGYKLAFLQHGIILGDMSSWLNQKNFDVFVTSVTKEYDSIINGNYKFTTREVVLTGLPRHDELIRKSSICSDVDRYILISPTWRKHLKFVDTDVLELSAQQDLFVNSDYYKMWESVLSSDRLSALLIDNGLKVVFFPHYEINPYINLFTRSERIDFVSYRDVLSVQDLISNCSALITDYSSIAFEAAVISKPIAYFHFSEFPSIHQSHLYSSGYFSYDDDGFGPVIKDVDSICDFISGLIFSNFDTETLFKNRIDSFFKFRDRFCCSRVYNSIIERT